MQPLAAGAAELEQAALESPTTELKEPEETACVDDQARTYPIDKGWRAWAAVIASFLQLAICLGSPNAFGVFQAEYSLVQFPNSSDTAISFIGGTNMATLVLFCLIAGRLCEVHGPRVMAIIGTAVTVAALLAASWCHSVPALIGTQGILAGAGGGCIFVCATWIVPQWFARRRALAMGIASAGLGAGGIAWAHIFRACIARLGYAWALRISAFVTLGVMAISILIIRTPAGSRKAAKTGDWRDAFRIFNQEKWLISYWFAFLIFLFGFSTPMFYLPQYIQTQGGASASEGATIAAVINAGAIIGRIAMGFAGDSRIGIMNIFCIGLALAGILQLCMWLPANGNVPLSFVFAVLYGIWGVGAIGVAPAVLAVHLGPSKLPSIVGVFFTSELVGFLTGPSIAGATLSRAGYHAVIGFSGGMMVAGSIFAAVARFQIAKGKLIVKV